MKRQRKFRWLALLMCLLIVGTLPTVAQEVDDLQDYLNQLATEQVVQPVRKAPKKAESVEIPVELTVIDLTKFSSYQNRKKQLIIPADVKFINGTITAAPDFSGGGCLVKISNGRTLALDETAGIDAHGVTANICFAAVGIYEGSTFYQCGEVRAPIAVQVSGTGTVYPNIAVYLDTSNDIFYYVKGLLDGIVYNPRNGTVIGLANYTKEELQAMLAEIDAILADWMNKYNSTESAYLNVANFLSSEVRATVDAKMAEVKGKINDLSGQSTALNIQLQSADQSEYNAIYESIANLVTSINGYQARLVTLLNECIEYVKAQLAADIQQRFTSLAADIVALQNVVQKELRYDINNMKSSFGEYYFTKQTTEEFSSKLSATEYNIAVLEKELADLTIDYNGLVSSSSISQPGDAIAIYNGINALTNRLASLQSSTVTSREELGQLKPQYEALPVKFPDEFEGYSIRPVGLAKELQMGYKSNRGFVLTSAGIMVFEQVEGATFRLKDYEDNYVVYDPMTAKLSSGSEEQATIWRGYHLNNGQYGIGVEGQSVYLTARGSQVNAAFGAEDGTATRFTITEGIDPFQALLNLLAEEAEEGEGGSELPKDTLVIELPKYDPTGPVPTTPFVFPRVPYPILVTGGDNGGYWTVPNPTPGQPRPENFHPIYIPWGSHVIIDDITFNDIVGGHHVIYVEGVLEINITINIYISNWEWFVNVGPGGRVIWKPTGGEGAPRIKVSDGGTFDFQGGQLDYVENHGTLNHSTGIISHVYNFSGGIYNMTGGSIVNNVAGSTETVFVNHGIFYFYGGIIGGYGERLIYHGPGATLRIDGGRFDFTYVTRYWIEAHNYFYIRGDYNYGPTVPLLLADRVTIRILYKWIYKWNIVFINGRPTPRFPLFWGDDFTLLRDYYNLIGWQLPNYRWRWYLNETENTIEPRDEEVEDEDDLQAYLDWLAEHQDDEAASTEEEPQQLDLKGRTIEITQPIQIPVGQHVVFVNGIFRPAATWIHNRMFYIPATTTVRFERVVIDFSTATYYVVNGVPVQRYIFDVYGIVHLGTGCEVKGYYNPTWQFTDDKLPGAVVYIDPAARFYLDGGRFDNVIFRVNSVVNIFVTVSVVNNIYIYVPTAWRNENFRIVQPWNNYLFTLADLRHFVMVGTDTWTVDVDANGYAVLLNMAHMGDVNNNGIVEIGDMQKLFTMMAGMTSASVRADLNGDGRITLADLKAMIDKIAGKN